MNDRDRQNPQSLSPADTAWATERVRRLHDLELAVDEAWTDLHDDVALTEKLRALIGRSQAFIHEIETRTSVIAAPATVLDGPASSPGMDSVPPFPPPPAIAVGHRITEVSPPGASVGPLLDLTAAVEAEKNDPSEK